MGRVVKQFQAVVKFVCLGIVVAVMVDDRNRPARAGNTGHLADGLTDVAEVVCRQARAHEIELAGGEWNIFRTGLAGFNPDTPLRSELSRRSEHVRCRVDQDDPPGTTGERQSEVPGTAADIADGVNPRPGEQRVEAVDGRASLMHRAGGVVLTVRVEPSARVRGCGHLFSVAPSRIACAQREDQSRSADSISPDSGGERLYGTSGDSLYDWRDRWTLLPESASRN